MKKRVLVTVDRGETRVAILERRAPGGSSGRPAPTKNSGRRFPPEPGWRVAELYVERRSRRSIAGNIYKAVVENVLPGMEAAFIDIDVEKNGFLHADDIVGPGAQRGRRGRGGQRVGDLLKRGQSIVVQVVKDPLKTKGARVDMKLSIPGRYMVYTPYGDGVGVSRRLPDGERERLRKLASQLKVPRGGIIVRTAAHGALKRDLERELPYLFRLYEVLMERVEQSPAPSLVFQEADLPVRVIRDVFSKEFDCAIIDDTKQHHRVESFLTRTAPELLDRVEYYQEREPLFAAYGVDETFGQVMKRRVDLPSGGYIVIDTAEALTIIDVNTGSFTGRARGRLEDTITKINVEAAEEVVRQLRLRDIGGIIVIDFIDMERSRNRELVLKTLERSLRSDRTKTYVMDISPLGLVEMTRQNVTEGVREIITKKCTTCAGEGVVQSEETIALDIERKLRRLGEESPGAFLVKVHPRVAAILIGGGGKPLKGLERDTGKVFLFEGIDSIPLDTFEITARGTVAAIEKRALPFSVGDEVLIYIQEPHMYNADDAIGKVDGYVVSVAGGGPYVGGRKLVRVTEVTRTAAYAVLPEAPAAAGGEAEPADRPKAGARGPADGHRPRRAKDAARPPAQGAGNGVGVPGSRSVAEAGKPSERPAAQASGEVDGAADGPSGAVASGEAAADDSVESSSGPRRRRGRRGGRGRSRRKADELSPSLGSKDGDSSSDPQEDRKTESKVGASE